MRSIQLHDYSHLGWEKSTGAEEKKLRTSVFGVKRRACEPIEVQIAPEFGVCCEFKKNSWNKSLASWINWSDRRVVGTKGKAKSRMFWFFGWWRSPAAVTDLGAVTVYFTKG